MLDLSKILNINLRNFLENYPHFISLSDEEKNLYLEKIIKLSPEKQENIYKYFLKENENAKLAALDIFYSKLLKTTEKIHSLALNQQETKSSKEDKSNLDSIFSQI